MTNVWEWPEIQAVNLNGLRLASKAVKPVDFLFIEQVKTPFAHTVEPHTILASCWGAKSVSFRRHWDHSIGLQQVMWPVISLYSATVVSTQLAHWAHRSFSSALIVIFINITFSKHQSQTAVSLLFNIQLYQAVIIKWIFVLPPKEQRPFLPSPTTELNVWLTNLLMAVMSIGSRLTYQYLMDAQNETQLWRFGNVWIK